MIGVTVGVGTPHKELATLAAKCFSESTGLPTKILGSHEFASNDLAHPAALRLDCFDYVDEQSIIYFDADWFNLNEWKPSKFDDGNIYAARDFTSLDDWPRQFHDFASPWFSQSIQSPKDIHNDTEPREDYIADVSEFMQSETSYTHWVNTGLMLLHRNAHATILTRARALYKGRVGHHPKYYEQPALNAGLQEHLHQLKFLPRTFNVLASRPTKWPRTIIGLHVKAKNHQDFVDKVIAGAICSREDVREYFFEPV